MCGRVSIDSLSQRAPRVDRAWQMDRGVAGSLPVRLREHQGTFEQTGGLHAAALFTPDGQCERAAEDVGRHNAVDKVIGAMLLDDRLPLSGFALVVSGRTSFEILQKAWIAGIGLVRGLAPSTLTSTSNDAGERRPHVMVDSNHCIRRIV
jgi:FdhD protein